MGSSISLRNGLNNGTKAMGGSQLIPGGEGSPRMGRSRASSPGLGGSELQSPVGVMSQNSKVAPLPEEMVRLLKQCLCHRIIANPENLTSSQMTWMVKNSYKKINVLVF